MILSFGGVRNVCFYILCTILVLLVMLKFSRLPSMSNVAFFLDLWPSFAISTTDFWFAVERIILMLFSKVQTASSTVATMAVNWNKFTFIVSY